MSNIDPQHYTSNSIECIDYIADVMSEEAFQGFLQGNITKYTHRWRQKNGLEDLKKAQWYLAKLIDTIETK